LIDGIVDSLPFKMRQREFPKVDNSQKATLNGRLALVHANGD
jgi:hypothetical protein